MVRFYFENSAPRCTMTLCKVDLKVQSKTLMDSKICILEPESNHVSEGSLLPIKRVDSHKQF